MKKYLYILSGLLFPIFTLAQSGSEICGLNEENMKPLYRKVNANIQSLINSSKIPFIKPGQEMKVQSTPTTVRFAWPMRAKNHGKYTYYKIINFTDLDTSKVLVDGEMVSSGTVNDYMGGSRTYDGHQGIDIGVGPYHWEDANSGAVEVIAAAPGIIVERHDGEPDLNCSWYTWQGSTNRGNHVVILHEDGSTVSYYMHMKEGSVTAKNIGDNVNTGEYLGTVASSGFSTGPHLHFQVNVGWSHPDSAKGEFVEPFAGPDNYTTDQSLWISQKPYDEPEIMLMETHLTADPVEYYSSACDMTITPDTRSNSIPLASHTLGYRTFTRDWVTGGSKTLSVKDPIGNVVHLWLATNVNNWRDYGNRRNFTLPQNPTEGTWSYNIEFNNKTYSHYFTVGCINNYNLSSSHSNNQGFIAGNSITSTATISGSASNNIEYKADNVITLLPGFTASAGCTFVANNLGCVRGN